jgi:hypothetical protein
MSNAELGRSRRGHWSNWESRSNSNSSPDIGRSLRSARWTFYCGDVLPGAAADPAGARESLAP